MDMLFVKNAGIKEVFRMEQDLVWLEPLSPKEIIEDELIMTSEELPSHVMDWRKAITYWIKKGYLLGTNT